MGRPNVIVTYLSVFLGGMAGGSVRYLLVQKWPAATGQIPWTILLVNLVGAFALAAVLSSWEHQGTPAHPMRPFLATGLLGSLTTWSEFMSGTRLLWIDGRPLLALAYLVGSIALGLMFAAFGWGVASRRHQVDEREASA